MKKITRTEETRKAIDKFIPYGSNNIDLEWLRNEFTLYLRNSKELYYIVDGSQKHSDKFNIWNVILTTLNNNLDDPFKYYCTASQVRNILKAEELNNIINAASQVIKEERAEY